MFRFVIRSLLGSTLCVLCFWLDPPRLARAQDSALDAGAAPPDLDAGFGDASGDTPLADAEPQRAPLANSDAGAPAPAVSEPPVIDAPPLSAPPVRYVPPSAAAGEYGARAMVQRPAGPGEFEPFGTGSKQGVPLEELPASVSVVDRGTLRERGALDLQQALSLLPGLVPMWTYGGFQAITARGFQVLPLIDGRRDSRPILSGSAPFTGLFDLERIEVLRGPAAVLYGYGAVGAAVNLIRRRASITPSHELELGLGLPKQLLAHAGSQGAVGPGLSYRVDLGHVSYENFRRYSSRRSQGAATLRYAPNRKHTLQLRTAFAFDRYSTDVGIPTIEDPARPGRWVVPYGTRYENRYSTANDYLDYKRLELALDYRFDLTKSVYVQARGAITRDRYSYLAAESLTYVPPTEMMPARVDREYLAFAHRFRPIFGELELHADVDTGPLLHQLVVGYQLDHMSGYTNRSDLNGDAATPVDFTWPVDDAEKVAFRRNSLDHRRHVVHSLYGFDHMKIVEDVILTGGVRLDVLRSRTRREFVDVETQDEVVEPGASMRRTPNRTKDVVTTGQVGLVYSPWQPITAYVAYASGFRPLFVSASASAVTRYTPERTQQFEGGLRLRIAERGHRLDVDAAGYLVRKKNLLIPRGMDEQVQAGLAQSRGLDLTARYQAPALVELDGGYSLIDGEYKEFAATSAVTGEPADFSGNTLRLAPRHSGTVWLRLALLARLKAGIGSRIMGRQWADDENRLQLPSYALLDAALVFGGERASFTLSANNLLDRTDYFTSVINSGTPQPQVTPGAGREILGTLRVEL